MTENIYGYQMKNTDIFEIIVHIHSTQIHISVKCDISNANISGITYMKMWQREQIGQKICNIGYMTYSFNLTLDVMNVNVHAKN